MRPATVPVRALQLLAGGACLLVAAGLGAALDGTRGAVGVDRLASRLIGPPSPVSGPVALRLAQLGDRGPTVAALAVIAAAAILHHRRLRPALAVVVTGAATQALVLLGKQLVDRTLFGSAPAYPSGHVAGSTAVLVLAVLVAGHADSRVRWLVVAGSLLLPVGTSLGNLWTQSHVMTDVVGGAFLGAGAALVIWTAFMPSASAPARPRGPDLLRQGDADGDHSVLAAVRLQGASLTQPSSLAFAPTAAGREGPGRRPPRRGRSTGATKTSAPSGGRT